MNIRRRTWLDYAIWTVGGILIVLLLYLAYSVWAEKVYKQTTSPAGRAVANLEKICRQRPRDAGVRVALAQAYVAADREGDAIEQYNAALKIDKDNPAALLGLGQLAMADKQWRTAESYWQRIIAKLDTGEYAGKDDRLEAAYFYLGTTQMELHEYEDAIGNLKEAIRIRPDASDTHYALSIAYGKIGSTEKSAEELQIALSFDPMMPEANYDYGQILLKKGDVAGAAEHFRVSADKAPNIDKPRLALQALGDAVDHVKKAASLAASDTAGATTEARIAVAIDPKDPDALRLLGQLFEKQGNKDQALVMYRKLQEIDPNDKAVADAVKRLKNGGK